MTLNDEQKIAIFRDRFVHQSLRYAVQTHHDTDKRWWYKPERKGWCDGSCPKGACTHVRYLPLTDNDILLHLKGERTLGIYQLDDDNTVGWMVFDLDIQKDGVLEDSDNAMEAIYAHALNLARSLTKYEIPFRVAKSGSKGVHIWIWFSEPVPAKDARAFGLFLNYTVEPPDGIAVEVFPKQSELVRGPGNLVKIPLCVHQKTGNRAFFVDPSFSEHPDQWAVLEASPKLSRDDLTAFIEEYGIETQVIGQSAAYSSGPNYTSPWTPPCMTRMMIKGFPAGSGMRDVGLHKLACYHRTIGIPQNLSHIMLREVNNLGSPVDDYLLNEKIESAYSAGYGYRPCQERSLDVFCSSDCRWYETKMKARNGDGKRRHED